MNDLLNRYSPRWLYLEEFMAALPGSNTDEKKEAIILLLRDRMIVDGKIDETHFRFLSGKPKIASAWWLTTLSNDDIAWGDSSFRAPPDESDQSSISVNWYLIEIAAAALTLFGLKKGERSQRPKRTPPEQARALRGLRAIYGEKIPSQDEVANKVLEKQVNGWLKENNLVPVKPDALQRAAGRRK